MTRSSHAPLEDLIKWSAKLGADTALVQGGGGNTSLKRSGRLHVKASGHWLADAGSVDMFVELDLAHARDIATAGEDDFSRAVLGPGDLRPSIETAMHALMPHPVVFHAHPVGLVAATVLPGARDTLRTKLAGRQHAVLPYVQPGRDLAAALSAELANTSCAPDIVVLANHGLVVGAETPEAAYERLCAVAEIFGRTRAAGPAVPTLERPALLSPVQRSYVLHDSEDARSVAMSQAAIRHLTAGALVPDQVVYLGGAPLEIGDGRDLGDRIASYQTRQGTQPGMLISPERGVYLKSDLSAGGEAMADMLLDLALRLPGDATVTTLSDTHVHALLGWDAEQHRQAIDAARTRGTAA